MPETTEAKEIKLHPAVNGAILNPQGQVLLTKRAPHIREPGKWCLPGGHFDPGESWQAALRRELREEIGIEVQAERLVGLYSDPALSVTEERLWHGAYGQYLVALFLVTAYEGKITPNEEVCEWGFFDLASLPTPIIRSHPVRVADVLAFRGEPFIR